MSKAKRMSNGAFLAIWSVVAVLSIGIAVALEVVGNNKGMATMFDTYLPGGKGAAHVVQVEGSESWDTDYYSQTYAKAEAAGGNVAAQINGEEVVEEVCNEGVVLLKNANDALPIATSTGITLLGRGSVDPIYGGSGSGNVDTTTCANPKKAFTDAGFTIDQDAYDFFNANYSKYDRQNIVMDDYDGSTFFIGEIPVSTYTFAPKANNVAVVFISRCGGEGLDLSTDLKRDSAATSASQAAIAANANTAAEVSHYADGQHELELSAEEKEMIAYAKEHYAKTVVVLNESTTMEIGELKNDADIDAIIWAGSPGSTGFNSLANIVSGAINPSGRTPDIYVNDFTADPTFQNFAINGVHLYSGINPSTIASGVNGTMESHFVQYEEGIYVGYKYYETRQLYEAAGWYDNAVAYPFGYGLSYTTFSKSLLGTSMDSENITLRIEVENTGTKAGKEVVQLYYTAPYTPGGIEKAATNLGDFAKTKLLQPGEKQTIDVTIAIEDMASYDYKGAKAYVLDAGEYSLEIRNNSHEIAKNTSGEEIVYKYSIPTKRVLEKRNSDEVAATNRFDDVSGIFVDTAATGYALNMSRQDFAGTFPTKPTADDAKADTIKVAGKTIAELVKKFSVDSIIKESDVTPTVGATNGLGISSMRGIPYADEAWDLFLDQLTNEDYTGAANYLCNNAYAVKGIASLGIADGELHDGPQGFSTLMGKLNNVCAYMSEPLLAATFNKELAKKMGTAIGEEALALNPLYTGWYGPAMNTHRSPFAGRNFEYYSEDGVLGGKIAAGVCEGACDKGVIVFIKHFACNDQETWRTAHLSTWVNEQALRETYLKPFEICVKQAHSEITYLNETGEKQTANIKSTLGVMSSFNYVGGQWAGGRRDLMHDVLRSEWGFAGVVSSDFNLYNYMLCDQGVYAGTDLQLTWSNFKDALYTKTDAASFRLYVRDAIHNLAYALANSNAMQGVAPGGRVYYDMSPWRIGFYIGEGVLGLIGLCSIAWMIIRMVRVRKERLG